MGRTGLASLLLLSGCGGGGCNGSRAKDAELVQGEIPGTGWVTFQSGGEGNAYVRFAVEGERDRFSASVPAASGRIPVLGLPQGNPIEYEVVIERDNGKELGSKVEHATVNASKEALPALEVTVPSASTCDDGQGHILFSFLGPDESGVAIIDREGNYVWSYVVPSPDQIGRVRPSRDGKSLIWNYGDAEKKADIGRIVRMSMDGTEVTETRTLQGHHDFVELPDQRTYAYLAYEFRDIWAPERETGEVVTERFNLGPDTTRENMWLFGPQPWQSVGDDLSTIESVKDRVEITLLVNETNDAGTYTMTSVEGGESVDSSGTFTLPPGSPPWNITLTQTAPEPKTLEGLVEVYSTMMRLELAQTAPDIGLSPPTQGLGSTQGPGYAQGDNVQTFRRRVSVGADAIYEVPEGTNETGSEHIVWSTWEDYGVDYLPVEGFMTRFLPDQYEFGHANSLAYMESTDSYFMMWRWLDNLLEITREGELVREVHDPDNLFKHAHFSEAWPDGMLVFDNRSNAEGSRLVEYDASFQQVWEYREPEPDYEPLLGDVRRIPGCDNRLVSWSQSGKLSEITREGEVVWEVKFGGLSGAVGRVHYLPDLYDMSAVPYPD